MHKQTKEPPAGPESVQHCGSDRTDPVQDGPVLLLPLSMMMMMMISMRWNCVYLFTIYIIYIYIHIYTIIWSVRCWGTAACCETWCWRGLWCHTGKDETFCPHAGCLLIKVILVPLLPSVLLSILFEDFSVLLQFYFPSLTTSLLHYLFQTVHILHKF